MDYDKTEIPKTCAQGRNLAARSPSSCCVCDEVAQQIAPDYREYESDSILASLEDEQFSLLGEGFRNTVFEGGLPT